MSQSTGWGSGEGEADGGEGRRVVVMDGGWCGGMDVWRAGRRSNEDNGEDEVVSGSVGRVGMRNVGWACRIGTTGTGR